MTTIVGHAGEIGYIGRARRQASPAAIASTSPACPNRVVWSPLTMTAGQEQEATALMTRAQQGDAAAYSVLLTVLAATARQYARNRLGDVAWLDDVAQETLLAVHAGRHTYDARRPFAPWFYAILSNRMIDVLRREKRVSTREFGTDMLPEPASHVARAHERFPDVEPHQLKAALEALPDRQRQIVSALKLKDESVKQVSERFGMTPSAVKVTAHRGYKALRRLLRGRNS